MSNLVLPSMPGVGWSSTRTEIWETSRETSDSGREFTWPKWTTPRHQYRLVYPFLRAGALAELQSLMGFFNRVRGDGDTWLYNDPNDNTASSQLIGVGDGATTAFQLVRTFGGFSEPVTDPRTSDPTFQLILEGTDWLGTRQMYLTPRTNLFGYSENLTNWSNYLTGASVHTSGLGPTYYRPDGGVTADFVGEDSSTGLHAADRYANFGVSSGGGTFTMSSYLLYGGRNALLGFYSSNNPTSGLPGEGYQAVFDLLNGVVHSVSAGASASITPVGNSWYRCSVTATFANTYGPIQRVSPVDGSWSDSYAGNGAGGVYSWGRQLELGTLTPYIASTGASATTVTDASMGANGIVNFTTAPAAASPLLWSGLFYWRCRFLKSTAEFEEFMYQLWSMKQLDFITFKP